MRYKKITNKYKNVELDYYDSQLDINNHFKYCSSSLNYVYFKCIYRRNNFLGTIRQNILTKEINITTHCNTLNEFLKYYENKEFKELPMESKKLQKFYVKLYIEGNKNDINITELKKIFKEETGKELILDNYLIGRIKCSINASLKGKEFYEICSIISKKNDNIKAKFFDIRYNINLNQIGIYIQI